jgi:hypothetical protein
MTEYAPSPDAGSTEDETRLRLPTEVMDVLSRGLVAARDRLGSGGELEPDSLICAGLYYDGTHYCPILYVN